MAAALGGEAVAHTQTGYVASFLVSADEEVASGIFLQVFAEGL